MMRKACVCEGEAVFDLATGGADIDAVMSCPYGTPLGFRSLLAYTVTRNDI